MSRKPVLSLLAAAPLAIGACQHAPPPPPAPAPQPEAVPAPKPAPAYDRIDRLAFNRAAVRLNLPIYWTSDRDGDGVADPDEIEALLFYPAAGPWTAQGQFTPAFEPAYEQLVAWAAEPPPLPADLSPEERERRTLVITDLDQGQAMLVFNDLRALGDEEKRFVGHMQRASELIDELYALQNGLPEISARVPADDKASQSLFRRNWGSRCVAPQTEKNPACSAIPGNPKTVVGVYPAALQAQEGFCAALEKHADAKTLLDPFTVVREEGGKLVPVPFTKAWPQQMAAVAAELRAAAGSIAVPGEEPLRVYLRAAADSFESNDWQPADEAWSRMNAQNSAWYVRVGPDETYWEPCSQKAGFHLTFARINKDSLGWQEKLTPVRQEMEDRLAKLAGKPYKARAVSFHLPDFIDLVTNAGDDRDPMGATIGQSLPNWGPVANEGRGRTVAMSNLYTDPDSLAIRRAMATSLLSADTMQSYTDSSTPGLLSTILHEAAHNLGPAHEYKVRGKIDNELFGGPLATTLEELKAQTAALWYVDFLLKKGIIDEKAAREAYTDSITWAFGHAARGMFDGEGRPKPYSQLAAIQIGFLMDEGAMAWEPERLAANGGDKGAFTIRFDRMPAAVEKLMKQVAGIKATGDKKKGEAIVKRYVEGQVIPQTTIAERVLRNPKANFVYGYQL